MDDFLESTLANHFAVLTVIPTKGAEPNQEMQKRLPIYSGFFLEISDNWFWITAGHIRNQVERYQEVGYSSCFLADCFGADRVFEYGLPIDLTRLIFFEEGNGWDIALLHLRPLEVEALKRNNIRPFDESHWAAPPGKNQIDRIYVLGVPDHLTQCNTTNGYGVRKHNIQADLVLANVTPIPQAPEADREKTALRLWGKIDIERPYPLGNIVGMSGGPWVGVAREGQPDLKYWLLGIQSSWIPDKHLVAACPTLHFAQVLKENIEGFLGVTAVN